MREAEELLSQLEAEDLLRQLAQEEGVRKANAARRKEKARRKAAADKSAATAAALVVPASQSPSSAPEAEGTDKKRSARCATAEKEAEEAETYKEAVPQEESAPESSVASKAEIEAEAEVDDDDEDGEDDDEEEDEGNQPEATHVPAGASVSAKVVDESILKASHDVEEADTDPSTAETVDTAPPDSVGSCNGWSPASDTNMQGPNSSRSQAWADIRDDSDDELLHGVTHVEPQPVPQPAPASPRKRDGRTRSSAKRQERAARRPKSTKKSKHKPD